MTRKSDNIGQAARRHRALSSVLYPALVEDAFYRCMEQSVAPERDPREAMLSYYDCSIEEAVRYGRLSTIAGLGAAIWAVPSDPALAARKTLGKRAMLRHTMGEAALETYDRINVSMAQGTAPLVEAEDWYLSILAVSPAAQGQGLGVRLMRPALEEADRLGAATYLETFTPRNMRFYERLGYVALAELPEPVTGRSYHVMRREPVAEGEP